MKTSELKGRQLDLAVGIALGVVKQVKDILADCDKEAGAIFSKYLTKPNEWVYISIIHDSIGFESVDHVDAYSTWWAVGGPLIDQNQIWFEPSHFSDGAVFAYVDSDRTAPNSWAFGATRLQAAMRCLVKKLHGLEIDLPPIKESEHEDE